MKKVISAFVCLVLSSLSLMSFGQNLSDIYTVVDKQAFPVIGVKKLKAAADIFAKDHKDYGGIGPETIWFVVNADGSIIGEVRPPLNINENINIYKYNDEVAFVKALKFKPATNHRKVVASWQSITIPYSGVPKQSGMAIGTIDVKGNVYENKDDNDENIIKSEEHKVFDVVGQMPTFPGGLYYLMSYLSENMHYPEEAQKKGIQGRVMVNFVVEKDGSLSDITVAQSVSPELDAEAVRVLNNMPKWIPGTQKGKGVRVRFSLPISFRL